MATTTFNIAGSVIDAVYTTATSTINYKVTLPSQSTVNATSQRFIPILISLRDSMVQGTSTATFGIPPSQEDIDSLNSIIAQGPSILVESANLLSVPSEAGGPAPAPAETPIATTTPSDTTNYYENDGTFSSTVPGVTSPTTTNTYYENDGTASSSGPGIATPPITTTYYENDGTSSSTGTAGGTNTGAAGGTNTGAAGGTNTGAAGGSSRGLQGNILGTRASRTNQDNTNAATKADWRVKLSLGPNANYLYRASTGTAGILEILRTTDGVIFPYTPQISVTYAATYDAQDVVHTNYKIIQYKNSSVDSISITCDFTAQDTYEANYLLAVIHFFRSVTKMFYGKDQNPKNGTPPPLCYLSGLGEFQFNQHPLVVTNFTYSLPNDVDYIRASVKSDAPAGSNSSSSNYNFLDPAQRATANGLGPGGNPVDVNFSQNQSQNTGSTTPPTYVPTRMQITIQCLPIITRNAISNYFSLEKYASGQLLLGNKRITGDFYGGIW